MNIRQILNTKIYEFRNKEKNYKIIKFLPLALVVIVVLTFTILWMNQWYRDYVYNKKYPDKEAVVDAYIKFMVNGNGRELKTIVAPDLVFNETYLTKSMYYTSRKPENLEVDYLLMSKQDSWEVSIDGVNVDSVGREAAFNDTISVRYIKRQRWYEYSRWYWKDKGRWYVILGVNKNSINNPVRIPSNY